MEEGFGVLILPLNSCVTWCADHSLSLSGFLCNFFPRQVTGRHQQDHTKVTSWPAWLPAHLPFKQAASHPASWQPEDAQGTGCHLNSGGAVPRTRTFPTSSSLSFGFPSLLLLLSLPPSFAGTKSPFLQPLTAGPQGARGWQK